MEFVTPAKSESKKRNGPFISRKRNAKSFFFQRKLTVGPVDDPYEREADAVADKVMRMKDNDQQFIRPKISSLDIQRKCTECEEGEKLLQKKDNGQGPDEKEAPSIVDDVINSSGKSLEPATKSSMENRFSYNFGNVKIHTDSVAAKSAQSINALAYTSGNNIVFNHGQYSPGTERGQRLLAHELTHVLQQNNQGSTIKPSVQKSDENSYLPLQPSADAAASKKRQPSFKVVVSNLAKEDIINSFRDNGNSFSFGWGTPPLFSWEVEVVAYGSPDAEYRNWVVGVVQLMKDYWLNIWWGNETKPLCGKSFSNTRDVKNSLSGTAWFNELTTSDPFSFRGDKKKTSIEDSPGALNVPYNSPGQKAGANFGHFNFGSTFFTYISAFNQTSGEWKHIKSVYWQTMLAGRFNASLPSNQRLEKKDGGLTEIETNPQKSEPKLGGDVAFDKICRIQQCWNPALKCVQIITPY